MDNKRSPDQTYQHDVESVRAFIAGDECRCKQCSNVAAYNARAQAAVREYCRAAS